MARALRERAAPTAITPHPAEAGRLLSASTSAVQADRIAACVELAARFRCEVVLKGAGSVCAGPDGAWRINVSGNPGLAAGGMGDVLTGMVAAFMAQRLTARDALALAVHLHGAAADSLVARGTGPVGVTASEVSVEARALLQRWGYRPDTL